MFEQILIAILIGIIAGTFTGLVPGVHINLIALLLFVASPYLLQIFPPVVLAIFIIAMAITHCFMDFVPSIFLGAPDENTALSVLPGHRMLIKGEGYGAIKLTTIGAFFGTLIAIALTPLFIVTAPLFYPILTKIMAFLLIMIVVFLIWQEKKKFWAFFIFAISGILGYATLNFMVIKQAMFPLFSGLFGTSLLMMSFLQNVQIPKQKIKKIVVERKEMVKTFGLSIIASSLVSFLPGVGSSQAATIAAAFKKFEEKTFLLLLGAVNTITMLLSFVALFAIQKPRSGVAVFTGKFLPYLNLQQLTLLLFVGLIAACISVFLSLFFAKIFSRGIVNINYRWLCFAIIIFIVILSIVLSGPISLLVLIASSAIGIVTILIGIKKIHMMGSLLLPVIVWHLSALF